MFYEGDLKSGIATAIAQSKSVACFVQDDGEESAIWENDYLRECTLSGALARNAMLLRIQSGSQEAHYLSELYPLPKVPTLVIIRGGHLKEYLTAGVSRDDFLERTKAALADVGPTLEADTPASSISNHPNPSDLLVSPSSSMTAPSGAESNDPDAATPPQSHAVRDLLEERRLRMEAQRREQETSEKNERAAKAAARKAELEATAPDGSQKSADMKYALMQKKRQQAAREERARILKRVEDDKIARREKEALRKQQTEAAATEKDNTVSSLVQPRIPKLATSAMTAMCAIQIRLFDGSTIRSRFPSEDTLRGDVRGWIKEQSNNEDLPYTFKQIMAPLPNRTILISEEEESLQALGLCPSATLVLVPVTEYTSAYDEGATGFIKKGVSAGYGILSSGAGLITSFVGGVLGSSGTRSSNNQASVSASQQQSIRNRSPRDEHTSDENHQLYNGNNLNFEPRPDEYDKEE